MYKRSGSGLGTVTAKTLYANGAVVIMACRNVEKANVVRESILHETNETELNPQNLQVMQLDLSSLESVSKFVEEFTATYDTLNILINNAGVMAFDDFTLSTDGIEMQFATNHIGHFALTSQLTPLLIQSASTNHISRVINIASNSWMWSPLDLKSWFLSSDKIQDPELYSPHIRYGLTKAAIIIHSKEYTKRFKDQNVYSISVHPGTNIPTDITKNNYWVYLVRQMTPTIVNSLLFRSLSQGAATQLRVAAMEDEEFRRNGGRYYKDCNVANVQRTDIIDDGASSDELGRLLWDLSEKMIKEYGHKKTIQLSSF